jgi:hypothetical protein
LLVFTQADELANDAGFGGLLSLFLCTQEPRQEWQRASQQQRDSVLVMCSLLSHVQEKECPFYAVTKEDEVEELGA